MVLDGDEIKVRVLDASITRSQRLVTLHEKGHYMWQEGQIHHTIKGEREQLNTHG